MQIEIYNPANGERIQPISWNFEELKTQIKAGLEHYANIVYTENDIPVAKKDRADLNRLSKAIDDKRKEMKKLYLQPYEEFEAQAKELTAMIDAQSAEIDKQVKEFEQREKDAKQAAIHKIYDEEIGGLRELIPYAKIHDAKWLNKGTTLKAIREAVQVVVSKTNTAFNAIDMMGFDKDTTNRVKGAYLRRFDLADAMAEKEAVEQERRALAEYELRKQAEERAKAEAAAAAAAAATIQEAPEAQQDVENCPAQPVLHEGRTVEPSQEETSRKIEIPAPDLVQIDFRVWATREQLNELKAFLMARGIKYGRAK